MILRLSNDGETVIEPPYHMSLHTKVFKFPAILRILESFPDLNYLIDFIVFVLIFENMTTVCTLNFDAMKDFYCRVIGMETDNNSFQYLVSLKGLKSEIRLQRVHYEGEKEVIGRLELETDEDGISRFLENRDTSPFEIKTDNENVELTIRDPDNNLLHISQKAA